MTLASPSPAESGNSGAAANLARETFFALGGVGRAGPMSQGERDLRAILKQNDAVQQLESLLKKASPAGQLYALLGLRLRDRAAFDRALPSFRQRSDTVSTIQGCLANDERMSDVVRRIEHGDYDDSLTREPW